MFNFAGLTNDHIVRRVLMGYTPIADDVSKSVVGWAESVNGETIRNKLRELGFQVTLDEPTITMTPYRVSTSEGLIEIEIAVFK